MLTPFANMTPLRAPGLPAVTGSPLARRSPRIGSTTTNLSVPDDVADVANQPSMKLFRLPDGGVETRMRRNTRLTGIIDERDLDGLRRIMARIEVQAERQSQGPLSLRQLAKMGHPYGRGSTGRMRGKLGRIGRVKGARGSVGNLAVINKQSGELARSWKGSVELDAGGVTLSLVNESPVASYLAFGTRRMAAHGPFTSLYVLMLSQINSEWQRTVRQAARRKAMEFQLAQSLGI